MLGEEEAVVLRARSFDLHGATYHDVAVGLRDRSVHEARLGPESVPEDLREGEQVLVTRVANIVVSIRRP